MSQRDFDINYGHLIDRSIGFDALVESIFLDECNYKHADPSNGKYILTREQIQTYL